MSRRGPAVAVGTHQRSIRIRGMYATNANQQWPEPLVPTSFQQRPDVGTPSHFALRVYTVLCDCVPQ